MRNGGLCEFCSSNLDLRFSSFFPFSKLLFLVSFLRVRPSVRLSIRLRVRIVVKFRVFNRLHRSFVSSFSVLHQVRIIEVTHEISQDASLNALKTISATFKLYYIINTLHNYTVDNWSIITGQEPITRSVHLPY